MKKKWKKPNSKGYILYDSICVALLEWRSIEIEKTLQFPGVREKGGGRREIGMAIKGNMRDLCGNENVLYLDHTNVIILVVIVH